SIGCFLTPDTVKNDLTYPPALKSKLTELVGEYPVDVKNFRTDRKDWLKEEIFRMSEKQWKVVRWLLTEQEWDYFHFVDIGLDRMHHGFWNYFDPKHVQFEPGKTAHAWDQNNSRSRDACGLNQCPRSESNPIPARSEASAQPSTASRSCGKFLP